MRLLILGKHGQLGQALLREAMLRADWTVTAWGHAECDVASPNATEQIAAADPDVVINAAAWTHVDQAEREPDAAYASNMLGPKYVAEGCRACGAQLAHISTNEIFEGEPGRLYREYDWPRPGGVYARSKLAGEIAAQQTLRALYIVRVAWLFGRGQGDFPARIIAAAAKRDPLPVVHDEVGNPTYVAHVVEALFKLLETGRHGVYHLVNEGSASRYEWTRFLFERLGIRSGVKPIPAAEYPRPVPPPPHAVLVNQAAAALGIRLPDWREAVTAYVDSGMLDATVEESFPGLLRR